jgi:hypothetical protein
MFYNTGSLKRKDTLSNNSSTVEFQLFAMIDGANGKVNEMKMVEPINLCDDYWFVNVTTSKVMNSNALQITMELKHSNVTQVHNGSWTVILLAIDPRNNVTLHCISLQQLLRINLLDLRQYLTEVHSIMKLSVQITVVHRDSKSYHSVLHDLQRNYDNIAQSGNIQIIVSDNEIVLFYKDILTLRSPVFKAMFDNIMTESNSNQIR